MSKMMYGEYDNYDYSSSEEMSLDEQISFMKKTLKSAEKISESNKNTYWTDKIEYIKIKLQQLEQLNEVSPHSDY